MAGIENLKKLVKNLAQVSKIVIQTIKALPKIQEEAKDIDVAEGSALLVQVVVEEIPAVLAELKA